MREAIAVMAKAPRVGRVKTRLHGSLGPDGATALYASLLGDTLTLVSDLSAARPALEIVLCYGSDDDTSASDWRPMREVVTLQQRGADLGERLANCFVDVLALGAQSVVVIGADSPTVPMAYLAEGFDALSRADVVLGPSLDGGYYLIGLRRVHATLFEGVEWSTNRVFADTVARAAAARLSMHTLPEWYDVDEPADLDRIRDELSTRSDGCPLTRAFLAQQSPPRARRERR